jgi:hypothetical protein
MCLVSDIKNFSRAIIMIRCFHSPCLLFCFVLGVVCAAHGAEPVAPNIVAQGFDISVTQEGPLGDFGQIRVRFEVPDRIAELYVRERSYEVDLATTPDTSHFSLFGINTQVRQLTDVTLDFQDYINRKVEAEGAYTFILRVTDRKGRSVTENLTIRALRHPLAEEQSSFDAVQVGSFRFERIGSSLVSGAERFGISWRTIDVEDVLIELHAGDERSSSFIEIMPSEYDEVSTKIQLEQKTRGVETTGNLLLPTVDGKAAGSVFGIISRGEPYLLRVTGSETSLSPLGTSVILIGEYKH